MDNGVFRIRKMQEGDIPQMLAIDLDAFPTQWPHPTHSSYYHELRNKLAHYMVLYEDNHISQPAPAQKQAKFREVISYIKGLFEHDRFFGPGIAATRERLVGMAGIWMMVDEAHIVTIAVRKSFNRKGMGEWLLIAIIELALELRAKLVTLEVRVSNTIAQALYSKYGFYTAGTRKKYYSDNGEDALIMSTGDISSPEYQDRFSSLRAEHRRRWGRYYAPSL
jgi:[ribosomal protein S18]-alanine N-acetyltransferase